MAIFRQAVRSIAARGLLPTTLSSAELEALDVGVRARAFFSARVTNAQVLSTMRDRLMALVTGEQQGPGQYTNPATVRLAIREALDATDYMPEAGTEGTIRDLRSDQRLNLIVRTQEQMATGYGQRLQSLDADTIDQWPAWELVRVEDRNEKREWVQRWRAAGGQVFPGNSTGLPLSPGFSEGRLIALKTDPIWAAISRFGNPHPPFDFNSGVGVEDVDRETTDELGLTMPGQTISATAPTADDWDSETAAQAGDLAPEFRNALQAEGYRFEGDVLTV